LPPEVFKEAGAAAALRLPEIPGWADFSTVLCFVSFKNEIDTGPIIEASLAAGKKVYVPHVNGDEMNFFACEERTQSGTGLPWKPGAALILTPGLAFDREGNRLGRGRAYYDRFLAVLDGAADAGSQAAHATICGLCLDCQLVGRVPVEPHDRRVASVLTEKRFITV
jgi:5-formyltetrahydrofolate cyclo-ligase